MISHFELGNSLVTASAISEPTLGFSDFSCAVSSFSQVFIVTRRAFLTNIRATKSSDTQTILSYTLPA